MNKKKPLVKSWKFWLGLVVLLGLLGKILPEPPEEKPNESISSFEADTSQEKQNTNINDTKISNSEKGITSQDIKSNKEIIKNTSIDTSDKPLTKDEVLNKFEIDRDIEPYVDQKFIFVGNRTDTADYYALEDNDKYRNASVIFKDGQIARVKLIPEEGQDVNKLFKDFGISEEPRKLDGYAGAYEVALIPIFWSQNIERYPFELD